MKVNESGRSMVEMLGVLAIIGVLSAGGLAGYSKAMFKHKLNNTIDQITMIVTNVRTLYGTATSYEGVDEAAKLGVMPSNMANAAGSAFYNPFKGEVTLDVADAAESDDNQAFTITINDLPREACVTIASADWGTGAGSGFLGVVYGTTDPKVGDGGTYTEKALPVSIAASDDVCGDDNDNDVTLKFY